MFLITSREHTSKTMAKPRIYKTKEEALKARKKKSEKSQNNDSAKRLTAKQKPGWIGRSKQSKFDSAKRQIWKRRFVGNDLANSAHDRPLCWLKY